MKATLPAAFACLVCSPALAVDPPAVPEKPIAVKKELLFSDDFQNPVPNKLWHKVVDTFTFENGLLKGTQTRDRNLPAAEGKPAITAHPAVFGLDLPTKDSVVEVKVKFEGASCIDVEFDDRQYTGSHYGHLCRAQLRLTGVTLIDERDGSMSNKVYAMKDPALKEERSRLLAGRQASFPLASRLEPGTWHTFGVETVGDEMRATLDGKAVGFLKSSGIGHATKSKIELGVSGKDGFYDDIKVWNAEPVKP